MSTLMTAVELVVKKLILISGAMLLVMLIAVPNIAQEGQSPDRGFRPAGSYAISDIETISMHNGDVMLHVPIASLPPGRSGISAGVGLSYDSKTLDSWILQYHDFYQNGEPGTWPLQMLQPSFLGGWKYLLGYQLAIVSRQDQYTWEDMPKCPYPEAVYNWKVKVVFPDGSEHFFRPIGYSESPYLNDGYFQITPDGWGYSCGSVPVGYPPVYTSFTANRMTYYSIDGSYLRLDVEHDGDMNYFNNPWTLYFPDGRRVTGGNAPQRIYDRNNNYVEIQNITYNAHPATKVIDQLDRFLIVEYDTAANQDYIYSQGFNNEQLMWTVKWKTTYVNKLFAPTDDPSAPVGPQTLNASFRVVDQIILPAQAGGLAYTFNYNGNSSEPPPGGGGYSTGWGEVSSVTLPSGAQANYQYLQDGQNNVLSETVLNNVPTRKDLTYLREYDGSSTPTTDTWTYSFAGAQGAGGTIISPDGGSYSEVFNVGPGSSIPYVRERWDYAISFATFKPDGSKIERLWQPNRPYGAKDINPYLKTEFTSIKDAAGNYAKTAIKDYNYDKNGNVTRAAEYDWVDYSSVPRDSYGRPTGIPAGASLKRVTTNSYYNSTPDASDFFTDNPNVYHKGTSPQLRSAIASIEVSDGTQTLSRAEFTYDNPSTAGNLIEQRIWDSSKGGYSSPLTTSNSISVSSQYNQYGSPTLTTDARGMQTLIAYGNVGGVSDLYPTQIKTAYQTSVQRTETRVYDLATGLVTSATDADNNVTTSTSYDVFGRPTLVKAADGKPEETRARTEYDDTLRHVIVHSDVNTVGDEKLVAIQHYDQLGRVRLVRQLEDSTTQSATDETTGIKIQTRYLYSGLNSYALTSNPYRAAYSSSAGGEGTMGWTRSKSDNSGRMIEMQTFGGSGLPAPWGSNTTSTGTVTTAYDANFTTATDQAGKVRRSMTNGLGQLVRVDEPDVNNTLGATDNPVQPTSYVYDTLGNLVTVNQGSQTRSFVYSSLARLLNATNPESGTIAYQYDDNGNLLVKTDARSVSAHYSHDALNRASRRWYNGSSSLTATANNNPALPSGVGASAEVTYTYDSTSIAYGKGRLASVSSSVSSYSYSGYDALGRGLGGSQVIGAQTYSMSYSFDLAGHITSMRYPSNHVVNYNYDSAGRLGDKDATHLAFTGNLGNGTTRTYSTGISYAAAGQMTQEQFGTDTPIYNKLAYNSRQQLSEILASTTGGDSTFNRGGVINDYSNQCSGASCNGTDNNGSLKKQTVYVPNNEQNTSPTSWNQQYEYDSLNRLGKVREFSPSGTLLWQQAYLLDRYGNRTIDVATTTDGIPKPNFTVNTANNRLGVPSGQSGTMSYDDAGNLTTDTYSAAAVTRVYDAENWMISETQANNYVSGSYSYDGDGRRVKRATGATTTWQVYSLGGELIAEYPENGAPSSPQKEYGYRNGELLITTDVGMASASSPSGLVATTPSNGTSVTLNWLAASGATNYRVERKGAGSSYSLVGTTSSTTLTDNTTTSGSAYLYKVCAANSSGNCTSGYSNVVLGAAVIFSTDPTIKSYSEDPLNATLPKAAHITELRTAVNAVRNLAGLSAATWTHPNLATGDIISVDDVRDLRTKLGEASTVLGIQSPTYTDATLKGFNEDPLNATTLKAAHIRELRQAATNGTGASGGSGTSFQIDWLVTDQLGTPRMIFDQSGSLASVSRHDYLPFGEELFAGIGGRTTTQGYSAIDGVRFKYTHSLVSG